MKWRGGSPLHFRLGIAGIHGFSASHPHAPPSDVCSVRSLCERAVTVFFFWCAFGGQVFCLFNVCFFLLWEKGSLSLAFLFAAGLGVRVCVCVCLIRETRKGACCGGVCHSLIYGRG